MKFVLPEDFFNDDYYGSLKANAKLLYAYIKGIQENGNPVNLTYSNISDKLRIGHSAINSAIHSLELAGLLKIEWIDSRKFTFSTKDTCNIFRIPKEIAAKNTDLMDMLYRLVDKIAA
jgi:DNA-binding transcriptional regulator GbsR (MarR family)